MKKPKKITYSKIMKIGSLTYIDVYIHNSHKSYDSKTGSLCHVGKSKKQWFVNDQLRRAIGMDSNGQRYYNTLTEAKETVRRCLNEKSTRYKKLSRS